MKGEPDIQFNRPLKECVSWTGQRQSGKSVGMLNFILNQPNPMEIWDTLGALYRKLKVNNITLPRHIKLILPSWVGKQLPNYETRLSEKKHANHATPKAHTATMATQTIHPKTNIAHKTAKTPLEKIKIARRTRHPN